MVSVKGAHACTSKRKNNSSSGETPARHSHQDVLVLFSVVGKAATVEQRRLPESGDLQPQSLDIWHNMAQRAWRNTAHQDCLASEPHCILSGSGRELNLPGHSVRSEGIQISMVRSAAQIPQGDQYDTLTGRTAMRTPSIEYSDTCIGQMDCPQELKLFIGSPGCSQVSECGNGKRSS